MSQPEHPPFTCHLTLGTKGGIAIGLSVPVAAMLTGVGTPTGVLDTPRSRQMDAS